MCGIFGMITTTINNTEKRMMYDLGILNTMRGNDSSGIAVVDSKFKYQSVKSLYVAPEMMISRVSQRKGDPDPYSVFFGNDNSLRAVIGHCRAATVGHVTIETAHPFSVDHLIGVHNGTIKGIVPPDLTKKQDGTRFTSDSYNAYLYMSKHTVEETYKYLDDTKSGAFALVWFNTKDNTLNFMRNGQRPLHYIEGFGRLVWSSSREDLAYLAAKNNLVNPEIKSFEIGHHYSIPIDGQVPKMTKVKVKEESQSSSIMFLEHHHSYHGHNGYTPSWMNEVEPGLQQAPFQSEKVEEETESSQGIVSVSNPTHHVFTINSSYRKISVGDIVNLTDKCNCTNCTGKFDIERPISWIEHTGGLGRNNKDYLVNSVFPLCESCGSDAILVDMYSSYGTVVKSIPVLSKTN